MRAREHGLARLTRATRLSVVGATAVAGAFAALAAHSSPGHKARTATASATKRRVSGAIVHRKAAVTDDQTTEEAPAGTPAPAPAPAPVTTNVAPVATTGTS